MDYHLFATLTSTTITTLRQRQVETRRASDNEQAAESDNEPALGQRVLVAVNDCGDDR
jgi:hypothetical protein